MSTSLQCRGVTSPAAWLSSGSAVWAAPLVVTAVVVAHQQAVQASRQTAVR
jgi:hypothetical protein